MENKVAIFENKEFGKVRTVLVNDEPWFVGKDIAECLGYAKPENALAAHVDSEDKTTTLIQGSGSNYKSKTTIINESGVYALIFGSKLPNAKKFKHWVTAEVLPSIRKNGAYMTPQTIKDLLANPQNIIDLCQRLIDSEKETKELQAELDYSKEWYSIKRVAKMNNVSWRDISWRALKAASAKCGRGIKKIFDANYGEVNTYHMDAWEIAYPEFEL